MMQGIQKIVRSPGRGTTKTKWVGYNTAQVLFSTALDLQANPSHCEYVVSENAASSDRIRFVLVQDPLYQADRQDDELDALPDIQIEPARPISGIDNPIVPYELGCRMSASDVPSGRFQFTWGGRRWRLFCQGRFDEAIQSEALPLVLTCAKSFQGRRRKSREDRRWVL